MSERVLSLFIMDTLCAQLEHLTRTIPVIMFVVLASRIVISRLLETYDFNGFLLAWVAAAHYHIPVLIGNAPI